MDMVKKLTLLASDIVALYGALAAVLLARYGTDTWVTQWAQHVSPFSALFIVWLFSFYIANLYEPRILRNNTDFFERIAQAIGLAAILSVLFFYLVPVFDITPKRNLFLFIVGVAIMVPALRALANELIATSAKKRLLIVGADDESRALAQFISEHPQLGWTVRAMVRVGQEALPIEPATTTWELVDDVGNLAEFIRQRNIDTVVVGPAATGRSDLVSLLYGVLARRVDFFNLATFTERLTGTVPLGAINQLWFLDNLSEGSKKNYETIKRIADVAGALVLGIPTLLLTPLVALAIKLDSPGPVFFRSRRTGYGGVPFDMLKFRSMRLDAEKHTGAVWASENDPRATRIGRILRKTRIDELPQLWNILKGSMSLVGPRAERPEFDAHLGTQIPFYMERYLVRPGLSGWAQINYPYGASVQDAVRKLEHDLYYLKHRSLGMDLEIILKTINISLRRAGR